MNEILGKYYLVDRENFEPITDLILHGAELTINEREKTAFVNKYSNHPKEIWIEYARLYVILAIVRHDSGNMENGDVHYTFLMR